MEVWSQYVCVYLQLHAEQCLTSQWMRLIAAPSLQVLMWNRCVSLVPVSLVSPISESHHDRIVKELQITASASRPCWPRLGACSSSCTLLFGGNWRWSSAHCCCLQALQPRCRSSCGTHGSGRTQNNADEWMNDPEVASSSSSSLSLPEEEPESPPAVKLRSKEQRPPWRYWRRTGPEPQHRQPGGQQTLTEMIHPGPKDDSCDLLNP